MRPCKNSASRIERPFAPAWLALTISSKLQSDSFYTASRMVRPCNCHLRFPISIRRSVRAGNYNHVSVRIAKPNFPMIRTAISVGRIAMARQNDLRI